MALGGGNLVLVRDDATAVEGLLHAREPVVHVVGRDAEHRDVVNVDGAGGQPGRRDGLAHLSRVE
eukprot:4249075-Lingulodinium_polyedra.AAC.1